MKRYKIVIHSKPEHASHPYVDVNVNGKKTSIPVDEEFVVGAPELEALKNAQEPYPFVIKRDGKNVRTETRFRPRFMFQVIETIEESKPEPEPESETVRKPGRPKKVAVA